MEDYILDELKKLRRKINRIPFTNKMKTVYTLEYSEIILESSNQNPLHTMDRISILSQLIDING